MFLVSGIGIEGTEASKILMAAVKVPRSRGHSGTPAKENLPKLEDSLNAFRNDKFDPQSYVQSKCSLNEKVVFPSPFLF